MLYKNKVISVAQKPEPVFYLNNEVKAILFILTTVVVSNPKFRDNLPIIALRLLVNLNWIKDPILFFIMFGLDRFPNSIKKVIGCISGGALLYDLYNQVTKASQNNFPKNK